MKHKVFFTLALLLAMSSSAMAYDFTSVSTSGHTLYYTVIGENAVEVASPGTGSYYYNYISGDVVIPSTVTDNGTTYVVTRIGADAFQRCSGLTSVSVPDGVTRIEYYAFYMCTGLTSINIPSGVTFIGVCAFDNCTSLTSINIPEGIDSIGSYAFRGCTGLSSLTIPRSLTYIGEYAFRSCTGLTSVVYNPDSCYADWAYNYGYDGPFEGCTNVTSFTFGEHVKYISGCLCLRLTSLTSLTIPDSVTYIGFAAFQGLDSCTSVVFNAINCTFAGSWDSYYGARELAFGINTHITSFTFGENVTVIPEYLCYGMTGLTSITIPQSVTTIGQKVFQGDTNLTSVVFNAANCTTFGAPQFNNGCHITSFSIGDNVTVIPERLCYGMGGLTAVNLPSSVTTIGQEAFYNCTNAGSITIPNTVASIGYDAFYQVRHIQYYGSASGSPWGALTMNRTVSGDFVFTDPSMETLVGYIGNGGDVVIPSGTITIEADAFRNCRNITSVTIPNSVIRIGDRAFQDCRGMISATIGDSVTAIGSYAFYQCYGLTSLSIGSGVDSIYAGAFEYCYSLTSVALPNSVTYMGNFVFGFDTSLVAATIGSGLTYIPQGTFYDCSGLASINIPNNITTIGIDAFGGCTGLSSINIPSSVTTINGLAFEGCTGLTSVVVPESVNSLYSAFSNCTGLTQATVGATNIYSNAFSNCSNLATINLTDAVSYIGGYAFSNCNNLSVVTIGSGVTSVGDNVFNGCNMISYLSYDCSANIPASIPTKYNLNTVVVGNNVTTVPSGAFQNATNLAKVTLGNSVTGLGDNTFRYCSSLDTIVALPQTAPALGSNVFQGTPATKVVITTCNADYASVWGTDGFVYSNGNFTLTLGSNNTAWGIAAFDQGVDCSQTAVISASPTVGHRFMQWSDGNTDNPRTITLLGNTTLTAIFGEFNVVVNTSVNDATMGSVSGGDTVPCDSEVTLTATATCGYRFAHWNDAVTDNPRTFVASQDTSFVAYFELAIDTVMVHDTVYLGNTDTCLITVFPYTMDFSGDVSCWEIGDYNFDGETWGVINGYGYNGTPCVIIEYADNADDWLMSPYLGATGDFTMTWKAKAHSSDYPETYQVLLLHNNNNYDVLFSETLDTTVFVNRKTTFSIPSGDTSRIVFRYISNNQYYFFIDDIVISQGITVYVHDTTYVDVHDTVLYPVYDTTYVNVFVHDTTYINVHDTTYVNVFVHDTTYINVPYPVHDTTTLMVHDTVYLHVHDTVTEQLTYHTISVMSTNNSYGVVAGNGRFPEGSQVEIAAVPLEGYRFVSWNDGTTTNPRTVTLNTDYVFTATFTASQTGVSSVNEPTWNAWAVEGAVMVRGERLENVQIIDEYGRLLKTYSSSATDIRFVVPASGVYFVRVAGGSARRVVVMR